MSNPPARFCAHANAGGVAELCACTALGPGPHTKEQIIDSVASRSVRLAMFGSSAEMTVRPASFTGVMSISSMARYR